MKTQDSLLKESEPFGEALKINPSYGEVPSSMGHHMDDIGQLRMNLVRLEQLQNKIFFMINEIKNLTVKS